MGASQKTARAIEASRRSEHGGAWSEEDLVRKIADARRLRIALRKGERIFAREDLTDEAKARAMVAVGVPENQVRAAFLTSVFGTYGLSQALNNNRANILRLRSRLEHLRARRAWQGQRVPEAVSRLAAACEGRG